MSALAFFRPRRRRRAWLLSGLNHIRRRLRWSLLNAERRQHRRCQHGDDKRRSRYWFVQGAPPNPAVHAAIVYPRLVVVVGLLVLFVLLFAMDLLRLLPGRLQVRLSCTFRTDRTQRNQLLEVLLVTRRAFGLGRRWKHQILELVFACFALVFIDRHVHSPKAQ